MKEKLLYMLLTIIENNGDVRQMIAKEGLNFKENVLNKIICVEGIVKTYKLYLRILVTESKPIWKF